MKEIEYSDVYLEGDQWQKVVELRGGCTCFMGHPPCGACSSPLTKDEEERFGVPPSFVYHEVSLIQKEWHNVVWQMINDTTARRREKKELAKKRDALKSRIVQIKFDWGEDWFNV